MSGLIHGNAAFGLAVAAVLDIFSTFEASRSRHRFHVNAHDPSALRQIALQGCRRDGISLDALVTVEQPPEWMR